LILDLAINAKQGPVPLSDISRRQNISLKYLEHLTRRLRKAGLIHSSRGPYGGHMLKKAPADITIGDIVRTLEKTTAITDCAETEDKLCGVCNMAGDCLSRWVWIEASKAMFKRLDDITVEKLLTSNFKKKKDASA
jgi:Rrf2 family iron-sulfur cluster assembly transcriptional regulator